VALVPGAVPCPEHPSSPRQTRSWRRCDLLRADRPAAREGSPVPSHAPKSPAIHSSTPGPARPILLVDPDTETRASSARTLRALGYEVCSVANPAKALAAVKAAPHGYGLVLTEIVMQGMDGGELAERVRDVRPTQPVVLMSATPTEDARSLRRAYPELQCVVKPLDLAHVGRLLRDVVGPPGFHQPAERRRHSRPG
jgi:two-component system capsular synthesis sensor histidine kinase RcsC